MYGYQNIRRSSELKSDRDIKFISYKIRFAVPKHLVQVDVIC